MRFERTSVWAAVCLLALLVAGCSDADRSAGVDLPAAFSTQSDGLTLESFASHEDYAFYPAEGWVDKPDSVASPYAKKGGFIRFDGAKPPKSFNAYIDNGSYTQMMFSMMYGTLISTDTDTMEFVPSTARRWAISRDGVHYIFEIDPRASWSDGKPVTAEDVKWTFDTVMDKGSMTGPWKMMLGEFESPVVLDPESPRPRFIRFAKKPIDGGGYVRNWRDILHCGTFWILPKHAFNGKDFNKIDLVGAPVGGAYRIVRTKEQVETEYARVKNWWRRDDPSCRGVYNFDRIILRYYISKENAFFSFKHGRIDVYPVYSARVWATETSGPKFARNWILKRRVTNHEPIGYQGFAMNMRQWPFDKLEVRQAMAMLVDRDYMNRTMMFNEYFLQKSYYRDLYDADHPCKNKFWEYDFEGAKRKLEEAGFHKNAHGQLVDEKGRHFAFKFLTRDNSDRYLTRFNSDLNRLGIKMEIVRKDFAGWMKDMDSFNFQMTWQSMGASLFRNPELNWLSSEADRRQSGNCVGFKNAEVDELIRREKTLESVAEREAIYRRIDEIVAGQCPHAFLWNIDAKRLLYWNKFGMPDSVLSRYNNESDVLAYWWYDPDRVAELNEAMANDAYLPEVPVAVDFDTVMKEAR